MSLISSDCSAGKDKIGVFPNSLLRLDVTPRHAGAKTNRLQGSSKWVEALGRYFIDLETYYSPDQLAFQILVLPKVYIIQTVFTNKLKSELVQLFVSLLFSNKDIEYMKRIYHKKSFVSCYVYIVQLNFLSASAFCSHKESIKHLSAL